MSDGLFIGIDGSSGYIGWAIGWKGEIVAAGSQNGPWKVARDVEAALQDLDPSDLQRSHWSRAVIGIEEHAFTMGRGNDGLVAWRLGYASCRSGMACQLVLGVDPETDLARVPLNEWRPQFLATCNRKGMGFKTPTKKGAVAMLSPGPWAPADKVEVVRREGKHLVLRYTACGHEIRLKGLNALRKRPVRCPTCHGKPVRPEEAVGLAWKRMAYDGAVELWPGILDAVLARGESRATTKKRHPSEFNGVSDAAEAVWITHCLQNRDGGKR